MVFKGLLDLAGGRGRRLRLPSLVRKLAGAVRDGEFSEDCLQKLLKVSKTAIPTFFGLATENDFQVLELGHGVIFYVGTVFKNY